MTKDEALEKVRWLLLHTIDEKRREGWGPEWRAVVEALYGPRGVEQLDGIVGDGSWAWDL